jgi:phage terminase large subunit-like protein
VPKLHPVDRYARDVLAGRIVAGPHVRKACARHVADRKRKDLEFRPALADHVIRFFREHLRLAEGQFADRPFELQGWQQFIVASLFGWYHRGGARRFRHAYVETGKGAGKTPMLAGILIYLMSFDGEAAAETYIAAVSRDQANTMFRDAVKMVRTSPTLARALEITAQSILDPVSGSVLRPVSSEGRSLDGKRVHGAGLDEIQEHRTAEVSDKMRAGTKGRRQPMIVEITNAGYDRASVGWAHHDYSTKVAAGIVADDSWFSYVCALDEADDPFTDEACWIKANPNLDVSISHRYLREQVERARGMLSETNTVLRLNFCVWTAQQERYIPMDAWMKCGHEWVPDAVLRDADCWAGLDLGLSSDFSAFVMVWRLPEGRVAVRCRFWLPKSALERHRHRPYAEWQRTGALTVTPGETTDFPIVEADVLNLCRQWSVREVAFDQRFANQMAQRLLGEGVGMVNVPQGFALNEALQRLLDLVVSGALLHGGDPILTWMADNLMVQHGRYVEIRPVKPDGDAKIDGIVALAMALSRLIAAPQFTSVYDERCALGEPVVIVIGGTDEEYQRQWDDAAREWEARNPGRVHPLFGGPPIRGGGRWES